LDEGIYKWCFGIWKMESRQLGYNGRINFQNLVSTGDSLNTKSKVALIRCNSYDETEVTSAVQRGLALLGGMETFIRPQERILLKPNVLFGEPPEKLVGPHPFVFREVARLAQLVTSNLSYGDSSGFGKPSAHMRRSGLAAEAQALGIALADFENGKEVQFKESPFLKHFILANGVLDADGLISIAKFKTHQLTRITGAIKNQFGCVPGALKMEFHIKLPNSLDFAKMLVCLNLYIRPRLYIVDGITAMQGNGPRNGDACQMNVLLFSADPVASEAVMCRLIGLNPEYVPTMKPAHEWGLGTYLSDEIELIGDPWEPLVNKFFNVARTPVKSVTNSRNVPFVKNLISPRPVIDAQRCIRCGICVRSCPANPKAVDWHDGDQVKPPSYKYEGCIRCFCCQESCPEGAIRVITPPLGRLLYR
jgi:uncharacterized protein (DUF362 family)/Pyruvate/2-oxoacid:ferredoxin oxidoreductase delta subunit